MASARVEVETKKLQQQLKEMGSEELSSMMEHVKFLESCMPSKSKDSRILRGVSLHQQTERVIKVQKGARKLLAICRKVRNALNQKNFQGRRQAKYFLTNTDVIVDLGCGDWQSSFLIYKNLDVIYYGYDVYTVPMQVSPTVPAWVKRFTDDGTGLL